MNVSPAFIENSKTIEMLSPLDSKSKIRTSEDGDMFSAVFNSAVNSLNTTNKYLSDAENEEIKLALGQTDNTHDLAVALQKASTALQYTVAVRDKFLEAYKEIMNMQI